jgi:hypothetical protein
MILLRVALLAAVREQPDGTLTDDVLTDKVLEYLRRVAGACRGTARAGPRRGGSPQLRLPSKVPGTSSNHFR